MKKERNTKDKNNNLKPIPIKSFALFLSEFTYLNFIIQFLRYNEITQFIQINNMRTLGLIIILIIVLIGIIFPSHHKSVTYYSKSNNITWNSTADPLIFTHLSDIHITYLKDIKNYEELFKAAKNLNASFHLLTGDLADNYKKRHFPKVGKQNSEDWRIYKYLLDTYLYNETILDISGNHDMFGVISPLRKEI